jgi:UDP-glucose 4-epimerase
MSHQVLVTGASGFVGTALCRTLRDRGDRVVPCVRNAGGGGQVAVGDLGPDTDWSAALAGCDSVIHLAARVHVMSDKDADPLSAYRTVNVDATLNLARQAAQHGVRRFVFVSSIKVNGEATGAEPFRATDQAMPCDPYGVSKLEAELALREFAHQSGLEVVIVRPPLVYGPGVKANFLNLMRLVRSGMPLPFGRVRNRRSMVALDNLVDLLILCSRHPKAPGGVFMVSDAQDMTIAELVTAIASAMGKRKWLLPISPSLMRGLGSALGKAAVIDRLLGSLQVDSAPTRSTLQWTPVITQQEAIAECVAHFLSLKQNT